MKMCYCINFSRKTLNEKKTRKLKHWIFFFFFVWKKQRPRVKESKQCSRNIYIKKKSSFKVKHDNNKQEMVVDKNKEQITQVWFVSSILTKEYQWKQKESYQFHEISATILTYGLLVQEQKKKKKHYKKVLQSQ